MSDDYDNPWKEAFERFLADCLRLLFPAIYLLIDWSRGFEVIKTEFPFPVAEGDTSERTVDFLAKVWLLDGRQETLTLHIEAQGQFETDFPERFFDYWNRGRIHFQTKPLSLVIFTDDNPKWKPGAYEFSFAGLKVAFEYPVAKLLDWRSKRQALEADDNPFAAFVLAQLDTLETKGDMEGRAVRKLALMKALVRRNISKADIREMMRLVAWLMRVPPAIFEPYYNEYVAFTRGKAMPFIDDFDYFGMKKGLEKGLEKGLTKGELIGLQSGLEVALEVKFGEPGLEFANELQQVDDLAKLQAVKKSLRSSASLDDLKKLVR